MREIVDECLDCPPELGCLGEGCPNRNKVVFKCDECGEEVQLYEYDGQELCIDCIKGMLEKVS